MSDEHTSWRDMTEREQCLTSLIVGICLANGGTVQLPAALCTLAAAHTLHIQVGEAGMFVWVTCGSEVPQ